MWRTAPQIQVGLFAHTTWPLMYMLSRLCASPRSVPPKPYLKLGTWNCFSGRKFPMYTKVKRMEESIDSHTLHSPEIFFFVTFYFAT